MLQHEGASTPDESRSASHSEDEIDECLRKVGAFLLLKARKASPGETFSAIINICLLAVGIVAAGIYGCQLNSMNETVKEMRSQRELVDRAWIEITAVNPVDTIKDTSIGYADPHNPPFPKQEEMEVAFSIDYRNVGHSPAVDLTVVPKLYLMKLTDTDQTIEPEEKAVCSAVFDNSNFDWWRRPVLFPEEASSITYKFPPQRATIDTNNAFQDSKISARLVSPILIMCARYRYASSSDWHFTSVVYEITDRRLYGNIEGRPLNFLKIGETMAAEDLRFRRLEKADQAN